MKAFLGLIGKNISHSRSPEMYQKLLKCEVDYTLFDFEEEKQILSLNQLFEKCTGISITSPYKEFFLDKITVDEDVKFLNAVNCLYKSGEKFFGTNTDYYAALEIVKRLVKEHSINRIVVLGNGPMSKLIIAILQKEHLSYLHLNRSNAGDLSKYEFVFHEKTLIVNGCSRDFHFSGSIQGESIFWDLNYNMKHSQTISESSHYIDGSELLYLQAELALPFWNLLPYKKI